MPGPRAEAQPIRESSRLHSILFATPRPLRPSQQNGRQAEGGRHENYLKRHLGPLRNPFCVNNSPLGLLRFHQMRTDVFTKFDSSVDSGEIRETFIEADVLAAKVLFSRKRASISKAKGTRNSQGRVEV